MRLNYKLCNAAALLFVSQVVAAQSLTGRWDAQLTSQGAVIPFRLDVSGSGNATKGTLYNGTDPQTTTSGKVEGGNLTLDFAHYLTKITATEKDGRLEGQVTGRFGGNGGSYLSSLPFSAVRHVDNTAATAKVPRIDGLWEIPYESTKGEKAWRFIVRQEDAAVTATILRIDGDTGALTGAFQDGRFILSHFDGSRPLRLEVTPRPDGSLLLDQSGGIRAGKYTAVRVESARAQGLPEPANFTTHTTVRDANEPFTFRFPDVNGQLVSSDDAKFRGKVILAIVTGTWCPNCHDEAQYLVQLYRKYRAQGLEIVALDFEEPEQQDELQRAKSFIHKYGVEYTYLIAGAPAEMWEKVPQAVNLNTWPATFFIGRDGLVKKIHAGFAAPASGSFHTDLQREFTSTIEQLLKQPVTARVSALTFK